MKDNGEIREKNKEKCPGSNKGENKARNKEKEREVNSEEKNERKEIRARETRTNGPSRRGKGTAREKKNGKDGELDDCTRSREDPDSDKCGRGADGGR